MEKKDKGWWELKDTRIIYTFDIESCVNCLCPKCGSSFKRMFLFGFIKIRKLNGCINYNCKNHYKLKKFN